MSPQYFDMSCCFLAQHSCKHLCQVCLSFFSAAILVLAIVMFRLSIFGFVIMSLLSLLWAAIPNKRPRRQGGHRQRLQAQEEERVAAAAAQEVRMSYQFGRKMLRWCDGKISAAALQEEAMDSIRDGFAHPMAVRLSQVPSEQHANEGMMHLLEQCSVASKLTSFTDGNITDFIMPSTWVRILHTYPHEFTMRFGADKVKLRRFWGEFQARPANTRCMEQHPALAGKTLSQLSMTIPLTVHADGAPFTKSSSCYCIHFSSMLSMGEERLTKFLCCSFIKEQGSNDHIAWQRLIPDFLLLAKGENSSGEPLVRDPDGTSWCFAVLFCKADEQCRCDDFGLTHYAGVSEMCSECTANRSDKPFTDLRQAAPWQADTSMSFDTYVSRIRTPVHPLVSSPFCCHKAFFILDIMHLLDANGAANLVYGGTLMWLLADIRLGRNKARRLALINQERKAHYADRPGTSKLPHIREANVTAADNWGNLHGPLYKAAIMRNAAPFFRFLVCKYCVGGSRKDVILRSLVCGFADIYVTLWTGPHFLDVAASAKLAEQVKQFGEDYMRAREYSRRAAWLSFPIRPKIHKIMHLPQIAGTVNPRHAQCYGEESAMGTVSTIYHGTAAGRYHRTIQRTVLIKRLTAVILKFELSLLP